MGAPLGAVVVDKERCLQLARHLATLDMPADAEEPAESAPLPPDVLANMYWAAVAICHQTSPKAGPALKGRVSGRDLRGWDYLRETFMVAAGRDPEIVFPPRLSVITPQGIDRIIQIADAPVVLNDLEGRARLLRDLGHRMTVLGYESVQRLHDRAGGKLLQEKGEGLLQLLGSFEAYRDPVRKKSLYFLALMKNTGVWDYRDPGNLGPPVDYHEVRGHLRCATVVIRDRALAVAVEKEAVVSDDTDIAIRQAVYDAIVLIARESGLTPSQLHYFFWNLFRSCCPRGETHCYACPPTCGLPERYKRLTVHSGRMCAVASYCASRGQATKVLEHTAITDFY